jgi:predicted TIM-barrel fold metal-dependent hydrolase
MTERYTIISADCHAGGSHAQYREYLDPVWHEEFDEWRGGYKNAWRDLQDGWRIRNWDDDARNKDLWDDGVIAEVVFPNTIPPFFPSFVLFAKPPKAEDYAKRLAGVRAHNRWMKDFCDRFPEQRAGIGQIFLNDIDDAIEDIHWIADNGLRGGMLLPNLPPDCDWLAPLHDPVYDPIWAACEERDVIVNLHGGTGAPDYGDYPSADLLFIMDVSHYSHRPFGQFLLSGVFERFPGLKFVMTEQGAAWLPPMLKRMDSVLEQIRTTGRTGELKYDESHVLSKSATEYFQQNCWLGVSQPGQEDAAAALELGIDKFMWGSDYPHREGTFPFTREHLRQVFEGMSSDDIQKVLATNCAELYGFDMGALAPIAEQYGPTHAEIAEPLLELPPEPNEALLKAAATTAAATTAAATTGV